jgi:hypothetical protein
MLLEQTQPTEALAAYKRSIELYPRRSNSLLGVARAARALGDESLPRNFYQELLEVGDGGTRQPARKEAEEECGSAAAIQARCHLHCVRDLQISSIGYMSDDRPTAPGTDSRQQNDADDGLVPQKNGDFGGGKRNASVKARPLSMQTALAPTSKLCEIARARAITDEVFRSVPE